VSVLTQQNCYKNEQNQNMKTLKDLFLDEVASQCVRVGFEATAAGNFIADGNHRAPLGETRAHLKILFEPIAKPSRPSVIFSPGCAAKSLAPVSTLMPGIIPASVRTLRNGVPSFFC
jgi:hypothetical protein